MVERNGPQTFPGFQNVPIVFFIYLISSFLDYKFFLYLFAHVTISAFCLSRENVHRLLCTTKPNLICSNVWQVEFACPFVKVLIFPTF